MSDPRNDPERRTAIAKVSTPTQVFEKKETAPVKDADLINDLTTLVSNIYSMYFIAHVAHWNIVGINFESLHKFFGDVYEDVFGSIDDFAEAIRQHKQFVTVKPSLTTGPVTGDAKTLLGELLKANTVVRKQLAIVGACAEEVGDLGLSNTVQDREAAHLKLEWKIESLLR